MKYIVYCTTCKVNGKIYIGVHKTENPEIFDGYIGNGIKIGWTIKNAHTAFQRALKKYGYSNFIRTVLYVFDSEKLAYDKEAEIVNYDFVKRRDNYNTSLGGIHPGCSYDKLYQYDFNGNFIREWPSVQETVNYYGCNSNRFNMAIKDKRSAFNSYWSKKFYEKLDVSEFRKSQASEIYCYTEKGDFIKYYNSVKEIISELGFTKASIDDAMSHKKPLKGYYFISDLTINIYNLIKTRELVYNLTDRSVSKYNKDGNIIQTYATINKAAKENGITINSIKKSIQNSDGIWSYGYASKYTPKKVPVGIKVQQFDLEGNLVKTWDSISQCQKEHPKVKDVLYGGRNQTHGYKFKVIE